MPYIYCLQGRLCVHKLMLHWAVLAVKKMEGIALSDRGGNGRGLGLTHI